MKFNLLSVLILFLCFSSSINAQTVTFTIDNFVGDLANDNATTSEVVGGVTYELSLSIVPNSGNVLSDNLGGGDLIFFESSPTGVTGTITADGIPLTSFDLLSADVDAIGSSTYDWRDQNGNLIFSGSTVNGTVRTDNFSTNNTGISGFNVNANNDFPGWHNIVISNPVVLPVDLVSFEGKRAKDEILLNWKTSTELNNDYFSLQKSTNGVSFSEIAVANGAGTTYESQSYSFTDNRPFSGKNYYRLQQVDVDGQFRYSKIISVDFSQDNNISIAPNPAKDRVYIANQESWQGAVELTVLGVNGQILKVVRIEEANTNISLDINDLRAGLYYVQIASGNQVSTQRFVKK